MMSLLKNKNNVLALSMAVTVLTLSGCSILSGDSQPVEVVPTQVQSTVTSPADNNYQQMNVGEQKLASQTACIKQLDSLKTFSPAEYKSMVDEFKEISEINALYRSVENTASKDSLALLKMSIESKTEVLCAKVRYLSVMSVNSTLKKLGE
ncbi:MULTISPECIES: hypothetical protein [Proteus]|uniref:Lipoprotein n=8 Tax=Enterobacterales TaxID=91347 RepID=A0A7D5W342_PROMI|nr:MULTISPECIES: hypothetical protein [Proteus]MBA7796328.1 hypothetical protein [Citrobacter sp. RHBSTW-01065]RFY49130.1 hypothetical protein CA303_25530 [Salmonella enterica subsp. enterica serovar Enteritidis]AGS60542.1 hypothetical protein BB2000_2076 [Proteus mirabilis BB2000]ALE22865.1 hypothetical protein AOC00_11815 [Proteus mirabilis]ALE26020.1 hypothetical protein AOB99_11845 [Proteus mirabilis]